MLTTAARLAYNRATGRSRPLTYNTEGMVHMTQALIRALALPPLYARTARAFWDDEHISAQMLKAHLAPDVEAASRRHEFIERSARWIAQLLPPERYPALTDFGCGPGLYAERFARAGYRVTGIDCSRRSIDYARRSAAAQGLDIAYIRADYLHLDAPVACDAATLIYCDYGALTPEERMTLLHVMRRCLRPGGRLLVDAFTPAACARFQPRQSWQCCPDGGFWSTQGYVALERFARYGDNATLDQYAILTGDSVAEYYIWNTYFTPDALRDEAAQVGFELVGAWGDVVGAPLDAQSDTVAVLLERR